MKKKTPEQIRKTMQAVKSSGSKIESTLLSALWKRGYRYRKNDKKIFGKPDITFRGLKIAVFVDSEFWHGKDWDTRKYDHKTNQEYWFKKIERNIERDNKVTDELKNNGWCVIRFWGEDIEKNLTKCVNLIESSINERKIRI